MKTFLSILSIGIVAMLLAVPTVAQNVYNPPGFYVNWVIDMNSPNVGGGSGSAQYYLATPSLHRTPNVNGSKSSAKLLVECEYLKYSDLAPLYVFLGPTQSPNEPFGKFLGQMQLSGRSATFFSSRPPVVNKGTTVTIVRNGVAIMQGTF
jgi:hypothetical protein